MLNKIFTTKISSRGQIVIPKELRKGLVEGTPFAIKRKDNSIILRKLDIEWNEFEKTLKEIPLIKSHKLCQFGK